MATGGHDKSHESLDLSGIEAELESLDKSSESEPTDSLIWENCQAELAYEHIAEETSKRDFIGFEQLTSTPIKSAHSRTAPTQSKSKKSPKGTRSAPVSPVFKTSTKVQQRIKSWEKLINTKSQVNSGTEARSKIKASPKRRTRTRGAAKKGLTSPLAAGGDFIRKRKSKPSPSAVADLVLKRKKVERKPKAPQSRLTMDQANIPRAGRLNPRTRRANGVGDTVASLGFPELDTEGLSPACIFAVKKFITFRKAVVADANLVLRPEGNMIAAKDLIESTRKELKDIQESFERAPADMAEANINGTAVLKEFIKLDDELWGLLRYCKNKIANEPAGAAAAGGIRSDSQD